MPTKKEKINLNKNLTKLSDIADWFDNQDDVDVEEGLKKVKEATQIIKESKDRLSEVANEFEIIKKDIEKEVGEDDDQEMPVEEPF